MMVELQPAHHPIIGWAAWPEALFRLFFLGGAVAIFKWLGLSFELSLLLLLVFGFSLLTRDIISSAVSQNVHLAEIRDALLGQAKGTD